MLVKLFGKIGKVVSMTESQPEQKVQVNLEVSENVEVTLFNIFSEVTEQLGRIRLYKVKSDEVKPDEVKPEKIHKS